ncbi:MAG: response regulator [Pseudomonadales bacterium]|nr:response regulator [Pseudomonadales bacterium]
MTNKANCLIRKPTVVYIADSDLEVGNGIQFLLKTANIQASVFTDGQALLQTIVSSPPSCVVAEAVLPDISGINLLHKLHADGINIPVIMLANSSDISMAVNALKSGAWDYFEKPFIQRVLLDSVQRAMLYQ